MKFYKENHITSSGVVNIILTLMVMFIIDISIKDNTIHWLKTLGLIIFAFVSALIATEHKGIGEIVTSILFINRENGNITNDREKLNLIRSELELFEYEFSRLFYEVKTLKQGKTNKFLFQLGKICKGNVGKDQAFWITIYTAYLILIQTNYFDIPYPIIMIVVLVCNVGLQLTNKNMKGIGKFVKDLFKSIYKETADGKEKLTLSKIVHTIKLLCLNYNRIAKEVEKFSGKNVMELTLNLSPPKTVTKVIKRTVIKKPLKKTTS